MSIFSRLGTCPSSRSHLAGFAGLAALLCVPLMGCGVFKIEPEEIDVAEDGDGTGLTGSGDYDQGSDAGTEGANDSAGDGDGDSGGDGDGDPTTTGDGDGDPGDGDGDATGDGDGDDTPCNLLTPEQVVDGVNPIIVSGGPSQFDGACGGPGPEGLYLYTAGADGVVQFALENATFQGAVYLLDDLCVELDCEPAPSIIELDMTAGQSIYILIDSLEMLDMGGVGSFVITPV